MGISYYRCEGCGEKFSFLQPCGPERWCPICSSKLLKISVAHDESEARGWFVADYRTGRKVDDSNLESS